MENNKLISDVRPVLLNAWDPLGVGNNPNLKDEYDGYIGSITNILARNLPIEEIVALLEKIENTEIGMIHTDRKHLYNVAVKLKYVGDKYYKFKLK